MAVLGVQGPATHSLVQDLRDEGVPGAAWTAGWSAAMSEVHGRGASEKGNYREEGSEFDGSTVSESKSEGHAKRSTETRPASLTAYDSGGTYADAQSNTASTFDITQFAQVG
jgi:hypothetical protein